MLTAPGRVQLEIQEDGRTVRSAAMPGHFFGPGRDLDYDQVFPMMSVPLGNLREECHAWRTDRNERWLGVAPFLLPGYDDVWRKHREALRNFFPVDHVFALMPPIQLWSKPFEDWTDHDWQNGMLSALWDLNEGAVLWADGAHRSDDMRRVGKPIDEFLSSIGVDLNQIDAKHDS